MGEEQKKEVSDLKFSDFQSADIKFDHTKGNILLALGIGEEEYKDALGVLVPAAKNCEKITQAIENTIKLDVPMKWKVVGLIKIGEAWGASKTFQKLQAIPDGAPGPLVKAMAMVSLLAGGAE